MSSPSLGNKLLFSTKQMEQVNTLYQRVMQYDAGVGINISEIRIDNEGGTYFYLGAGLLPLQYVDRLGVMIPIMNCVANPLGLEQFTVNSGYVLARINATLLSLNIVWFGNLIQTIIAGAGNPQARVITEYRISPNGQFIGIVYDHAITFFDRYYELWEKV